VSTLAWDRRKPDSFPITRVRNIRSVDLKNGALCSSRTCPKYIGGGRLELRAFTGRGSLPNYDSDVFHARRGSLLRLMIHRKVDNDPDLFMNICKVEFKSD
jgi:hypothetical protein